MTTLRQYEARARQSMIMTLNNNIRDICNQTGLNDYYKRLQELTTYEIWLISSGCALSHKDWKRKTSNNG